MNEAPRIQIDWLVAKCEGGTRKPTRCCDCRHYEERQGRDENYIRELAKEYEK